MSTTVQRFISRASSKLEDQCNYSKVE